MKILLASLFTALSWMSWAQPATEVWLFDIATDGALSNPINVSSNPGYDNQPSFTRGGNKLLYTSTRNSQTDIVSYDIRSEAKDWLTSTPGSEYSPTQIPGSFTFSTILLEEDGRQLLWLYSLNGGAGEVLIPFVKIGYHVWLNEEELYAFVLGPHSTLQQINTVTQRAEIVQENIGRGLGTYEGKIIFVDTSGDEVILTSLDPKLQTKQAIIAAVDGSQDFTISSDGYLYMGAGTLLYRTHLSSTDGWTQVADLTAFGRSGITRLAISPNDTKIAIVVTE